MSTESAVIISAASYIVMAWLCKKKEAKKRRWWQRMLLKRRNSYSGNDLLNDLRIDDCSGFKNFTRFSISDFEYLANLIGPKIKKTQTSATACIHARCCFQQLLFTTVLR